MSTMEQVEVGKYQPYPEYKDSGLSGSVICHIIGKLSRPSLL
jgi:hypothetical protein